MSKPVPVYFKLGKAEDLFTDCHDCFRFAGTNRRINLLCRKFSDQMLVDCHEVPGRYSDNPDDGPQVGTFYEDQYSP